ncbi:MAG: VOC family protein [Caldilineaceae bacterium]|nr:VOC family protein [Caldilineaceae bacterium]
MGTLTGPDFVALQVRDLDAASRFYREVVGLTLAPASPPDAVVFATKPIAFAVRKPLVDLDAVARLGHGVALWFHAEDALALHERLQAAGVPIVRPIGESPFGKTFTFADPDGYLITVHDRA